MKNRKLLWLYIKDHIGVLVAFSLIYPIMAMMLLLYNFSLVPLLYSFFISFIPAIIIFSYSFYRFRNRYLDIERFANLEHLNEKLPAGTKSLDIALGAIIEKQGKIITRETEKNHLAYSELSDYYTMWVHQIKTPIAAANMILQQTTDKNSAALKQELFKIERYTEMVLGFIRLESTSTDFNFKRYNIYDIVKSVVKKHSPVFIYKKISLELSEFKNEAITDEKWLGAAIEQVISNALKYTKTGSIKIYMDDNDVLYIKDTGIGIKSEDLPRVFEKGYTGFNGRMNKSSTGLGLYLCKKIMDKLSCRIEILSSAGTEGSGTLVKMYLHKGEIMPE